MGRLLSALALAGAALPAMADMSQPELGTVTFIKGQYQLVANDKQTPLTGLSLQQLRQYEGQQVKVAGEVRENGALEVYRLYSKQEGQFVVSYDWEAVDAELYNN